MVERILKLCKEKGISARRLCKEVNLSVGTLNRWRESSPSVDSVNRVAGYLGVSIDYLVNGDSKDA